MHCLFSSTIWIVYLLIGFEIDGVVMSNWNIFDEDAAYWRRVGQNLLREELNKRPIDTAAKNVILFLGDGE